MATWFQDGTYDFINSISDVERTLNERLGPEPARDIMLVINKRLREEHEIGREEVLKEYNLIERPYQ